MLHVQERSGDPLTVFQTASWIAELFFYFLWYDF